MTTSAYAINKVAIRSNGKKIWIDASTKNVPSVVELDDDTFARLKAAGAVREATEEERPVAKIFFTSTATTETAATTEATSTVGDTKPASGAVGDPQSGKKSSKTETETATATTETAATTATATEEM